MTVKTYLPPSVRMVNRWPDADKQALQTKASVQVANPVLVTPDPVAFIEKEMYIPETERPMELTDHQKRVLYTAFQRNRSGQFKYSTIVYSSIKKSAKTTIGAALALWMAYKVKYAHIYMVGNDQRQADSRMAEAARACIKLNPRMQDVKMNPSGYHIDFPNHAVIDIIPVDPSGEAGMNPTAVFWTEAWAARNKAAMQLWTETTLSPTQYGQSFRFVESYAGYSDGNSPLLWNLYEQGVKHGKRLDDEIEMYENEAASLFTYWNTTYHLPWQTPEYYAQQEAVLLPEEYRRVHHNEWASGAEVFCPAEWWGACEDYNLPPVESDQPCILVADAGVSNDSFGVLVLSGRGDGINYDVRYAQAFYPPHGGKLNFSAPGGPEHEIRRLLERFNCIEFSYDEYQLHDMATRFKNEMLVHCYAFPQGKDRLVSDKNLRDNIQNRRVHHYQTPDLDEHVTNANVKKDGDDKMRLVKRNEHAKIDLAVCLSMALSRAQYWRL